MKASENCFSLIKKYESFSAEAYLCPVGVWTIGWGTTRYPSGHPVRKGDTCTGEEAQDWLEQDVEKFESAVSSMVSQPINQPMFDALVSWTYNVGIGAMQRSTLIRMINEGDWLGSVQEFDRWTRGVVNGQMVSLRGLQLRRDEEQAMFENGIDQALAFADQYMKDHPTDFA
jgi:lysozyme